mgnify:CR=1 FL=1
MAKMEMNRQEEYLNRIDRLKLMDDDFHCIKSEDMYSKVLADEVKYLKETVECFNLQIYVNSYISGNAVRDNGIDSGDFNACQARILEIQDYLKKVALEIEENIVVGINNIRDIRRDGNAI